MRTCYCPNWGTASISCPTPSGCDDELLALVAYTYDNQSGSPNGQFYDEVNRALRNRRGRRELVQRWGGVLYYLMAALTRLPDMSGLFFRVAPDRLQLSNYPVGGRVQYGAFFSVTADLATATNIANTATDVILRLRLKHHRQILYCLTRNEYFNEE